MSFNNIYNNYDIRKGAFPRKVKPAQQKGYKSWEPHPSNAGHTLTRDTVKSKRNARFDRSTKHMTRSRTVPATGPVR